MMKKTIISMALLTRARMEGVKYVPDQEINSFFRAFTIWTGMSISDYRKREGEPGSEDRHLRAPGGYRV